MAPKHLAPEVAKAIGANQRHKDRQNYDNCPKPKRGEPPMPTIVADWPKAKNAWHHFCNTLSELGVLATSDEKHLTMAAITWALYEEAAEKVKQEGMIRLTRRSPHFTALSDLAKDMYRIIGEMGLTPASRRRVVVPKQDDDNDPYDALLQRMKRG